MRRPNLVRLPLLAALLLTAAVRAESPVPLDATELLDELLALPGVVSAIEAPTPYAGTLFFRIEFEQPVDHDQPLGPTFLQRLTLLHREFSVPTVLASSGYGISLNASQRELTYLLQANQLYVEHRFFGPSSPDPKSWEHLTIAQAAADHHRIVESFRTLYVGKWASTGGSKGGMTSVYHRFFYPDDVDVTVPYVAPSSHGTEDVRYRGFLDRVGTADCRTRLRTFQEAALARRAELVPQVTATYGADEFDHFGEDKALEFAVVELPFAFWQYRNLAWCDSIPAGSEPALELFDFIEAIVGVAFLAGDSAMEFFAPYYYQGATELGGPRYDERDLEELLLYPRQDVYAAYPPVGVEKTFDATAMLAVERWVRNEGARLLFVYGEYDPWSTGAFRPRASNDAFALYVPAGNHGSSLLALPEPERSLALGKLEEWLGVPVTLPAPALDSEATPAFDPFPFEELFLR